MESIQTLNEAYPWLFVSFAFVFGACIGSFLNVVIYRVPAGESIVSPGSHCRCGAKIAWYDNIPVLSWFLLGGRCRRCRERFSIRYPAVEFLVGVLFAFTWWQYSDLRFVAVAIFVSLIVAQAFIDWDTMEIPDEISVGGFVVGLLVSLLIPALHAAETGFWGSDAIVSLIESLLGAFVGSGLVLWLALVCGAILKREAMGFGDVKLMGAIGAFCGWEGAVFAVFGGSFVGLFLVILSKIPAFARKPASTQAGGGADQNANTEADAPIPVPAAGRQTEPDSGSSAEEEDEEDGIPEGSIPFGPALGTAGVLYLLWAHPYFDAYLRVFEAVLFGHGEF